MRQQQEGSRSRANKQSNRGEGTGQTLLPYEEEPLAIVVAAARPLCEQTKPKYESSCSCTSTSSPVFAMSNQLAARIMPHSNLCRSWIICSTRSFRVLHAGVDTQQPNHLRHPPPSLTAELYASPYASFPFPLCALVPLFSCHLASWCEHMPGACGTVPRPQSTIHLQQLPLLLPLPLLSFVFGLAIFIYLFLFLPLSFNIFNAR